MQKLTEKINTDEDTAPEIKIELTNVAQENENLTNSERLK